MDTFDIWIHTIYVKHVSKVFNFSTFHVTLDRSKTESQDDLEIQSWHEKIDKSKQERK